MSVQQISVFVESKPGHLSRVVDAFTEANVSVRGYSAFNHFSLAVKAMVAAIAVVGICFAAYFMYRRYKRDKED